MRVTLLRRRDCSEDGEPKTWGIKAMLFLAHKVNAGITLRREDWTVLEFDRVIPAEELVASISPEKFMVLNCAIEYCDKRDKSGAS